MQKTQIIGSLGKDAEVKEVNGKQVANFSVAVNNGKDKPPTWYQCALWDKPNIYPYIKKGDKIYCEGSVSADAYLKDNSAVGKLRMTVYQVELLGGSQPTQQPAQQASPAAATEIQDHSDLPF